MEEWKEAARKEVNRSKEIENAGLNRFFRNQTTRDNSQYQTQKQTNSTRNSGIVPMEVDATGMTLPFKKLTDEERAKYRAEGRCFRCCTQGHMARNCPKGSNRPRDANAREANATAPTTSPPSITPPPRYYTTRHHKHCYFTKANPYNRSTDPSIERKNERRRMRRLSRRP